MKKWIITWHDGYNFNQITVDALGPIDALNYTSYRYMMSQVISVTLLPIVSI